MRCVSRSRTVFKRNRIVCVVSTLLFAALSAHAETEIRALTGIIDGHQVGGVTIDLIGNIYVADFGDYVWKITPEGERREFASGFYGSSGNAIDSEGNLLQSNFYGDSITKVDRKGQTKPFVTNGLSRPVGIAIDRKTGDVYVANCGGNSITKIKADGTASTFAKSDLFRCPNGIAFDRGETLYVANFRNRQRRARSGRWNGRKGAAVFSERNCLRPMGAAALHQRVCERLDIFAAAPYDHPPNNSVNRRITVFDSSVVERAYRGSSTLRLDDPMRSSLPLRMR